MPLYGDKIYGNIVLSTRSQKIINVPLFGRLKHIAQVGGSQYIFKSASHSRFEHSLGVAYLASYVGRKLSKCQPELNITHRQIMWLEWAGLLHDIGHGPFSHLFDKTFCDNHGDADLSHEERSKLFATYIMGTQLKPYFTLEDIAWVCWLIDPKPETVPSEKYQYLGDIVANKTHGIDVDKLDYLSRDAFHYGCVDQVSWDVKQVISNSRVCFDPFTSRLTWCFDFADAKDLEAISTTRQKFFQRFYTHPQVIMIDKMIEDLFHTMETFLNVKKIIVDIGKLYKRIIDGDVDDTIELDTEMIIGNFTALTDKFVLFLAESDLDTAEQYRKILEREFTYQYLGVSRTADGNVDDELDLLLPYGYLIAFEKIGLVADQGMFAEEKVVLPWGIFINWQAPQTALPKISFHVGGSFVELQIKLVRAEFKEYLYHVLGKKKDLCAH